MADGENHAGVLGFGPRNHYRAWEKDKKGEKLKANSPGAKNGVGDEGLTTGGFQWRRRTISKLE
jgi:hypothetical protein